MPEIGPSQSPISVRPISCTRSMNTGTQNMKPSEATLYSPEAAPICR